MQQIALRNAHLKALVLPSIGGGLARLDALIDGQFLPVLRGLDDLRGAPLPTPSQLACFPLVPWSNRIGSGGFVFDGRTIALAPNRPGEAYPIHGEGFQHSWTVTERDDSFVQLQLDRSSGKPFAYRAHLRYILRGKTLEVELAVRNCGAAVLPFGLGLHPWLPRTAGVTLRARACSAWARGDDGLPTDRIAIPEDWNFDMPRRLPERAIDNIFSGWDGEARIVWPESSMQLRIRTHMAYYIVYTRPGADFFCFEPVDHMINAHNMPGGPVRNGLTLLAPGQSLTRKVRFTAGVAE
ncbi:aldose 1-epimerase [Massilia sp. CF038]|uniref:aldose 1-epimerase n=1 Tax=Massilia sp. CF038 TaxID=1881045 RepID=UPI000923D50B|nr:aldose 1-epimerase [Massilia sp. CF038]SHG64089.1 aldose 1-epimerase [Massilia sp. CF038]